ncbi:MAG: YfcE family phosphodiesterase [Oscillospiraceae bacterium]
MKLIAFADSHNAPRHMLAALARHKDVEACFFLGDGERDIGAIRKAFPLLPLYSVQGNCDPNSFEPYEGMAPFGGVLFFYTHGHSLFVKQDLESLWWTAQKRGADAALFGHTHVPYYEFRNGIHLFCPGSISFPRFGAPTYGLITVENQRPSFEICKAP